MWQWLRRSFITGFFVMVPLVVSVVALVWMFRVVDRLTGSISAHLFGADVPAVFLPALGIALTALLVLAMGVLARNMIGRKLLQRAEGLLLHVPVFRTIYAPVKQLMAAFSPDNESGFKRVALVEDPARGFVLGFVTKEFTIDRGDGPEVLVAVYVPTNNLYLGDVVVCRSDRVWLPDLSVEQGVSIFLTGGTALPTNLALHRAAHDHVGDFKR